MPLNVNEIFYTIQGEGPMVGVPSIFVRLAGCNLRCVWCDTSFTWLYSDKMADDIRAKLPESMKTIQLDVYDKNEETHTTEVKDVLKQVSSFNGRHVVISGGEPLLQKQVLSDFAEELVKRRYSIEIETNGTVSPKGLSNSIRFNVSPKLSNSYNDKQRRYKPSVLREFVTLDSVFKFVIANENDLKEVLEIVEDIEIPNTMVYLMPEGRTSEELAEKSQWLVELCKQHDFRYTHRLHIDLFKEKRGV